MMNRDVLRSLMLLGVDAAARGMSDLTALYAASVSRELTQADGERYQQVLIRQILRNEEGQII